jgi:putative tryptophan/tyrosine transport system substrate-binding protein
VRARRRESGPVGRPVTPTALPLSRLPYLLPHVRVQRLVHTILSTRWDAATWPIVRAQVAAQASRAGHAGGVVELGRRLTLGVIPPHHPGMDRRRFVVTALAGALVPPPAVEAQPTARAYRVGFVTLNAATSGTGPPVLDALRQALKELGYNEGKNFTLEARFADGRPERLTGFAQELLRLRSEVVVTLGTPATVAARDATTSVPIVFIAVGDPVGSGFVASLARPGGNLTGFSFAGPELAAKNLELLKHAAPDAARIAVLIVDGSDQPLARGVWAELERVAPVLHVKLQRVPVPPVTGRLDEALAALRAHRPDALLTLNDPFFFVHRERILATATELRLPTMFQTTEYARAGGLLAYVPNIRDQATRAGSYVDRILKGARPADLAIQLPTKFDLTINLKTAKALGLTLPPSLLARADQIIE